MFHGYNNNGSGSRFVALWCLFVPPRGFFPGETPGCVQPRLLPVLHTGGSPVHGPFTGPECGFLPFTGKQRQI